MYIYYFIVWCVAIVAEMAIYLLVAQLSLRRATVIYLWNLISSFLAGVINSMVSFVVMMILRQWATVISIGVLIVARFLISRIILAKKASLAGTQLQLTAALISTVPL